ncbi:tail fiber assembly protein [Citrobacter freundii]|uniref:tail fiber assembly protein n=1 Tax=Citrobacter freundii TaxID=546 RepID=UPI0015E90F53|nr:tail fiber assembly protein [Citrobacter freundii]EJR7285186.1 tail fiber assembly protein [Citrobacter freundii]EKW8512326.1 tail fiber assembly protein [Citrobacter freundii]MDN4238504.1 tail fiber assembly protein [Citrobacter freundii]MDN4318612.1 tail fiber assembly protein [Citrobacter freundii]MDT7289272.1 tail fiber assembly protein [Citrobacter freundii]
MFYPYALEDEYRAAGLWPESGHDVDESLFAIFTGQPPAGKTRIAGVDELPAWGDIPPQTPEQIAALAKHQQAFLLSEASTVIAPLKDALDGGYIDDEDKLKLTAWQKYRYALTKVDLATPSWPAKPA